VVNCRFTVSIHMLCLLATKQPEPLTSEYIAGSVNTNPVVIRRLLAVLRQAGLVRSQPGVTGGWVLVPDAAAITLGKLYQIVNPGTVFSMHTRPPNPRCPIGSNIQRGLSLHYLKAQTALEAELARSTIAGVLADVLAKAY
jgi:DNA-binding IscR family transcriptional regulator